jgi:hypothetical protein
VAVSGVAVSRVSVIMAVAPRWKWWTQVHHSTLKRAPRGERVQRVEFKEKNNAK